jgi:DNA-binding CsgD family transcriptional regulator
MSVADPYADRVDPVDRFVARLYLSALSVAPEQYRSWALNALKAVVPHDFALWGTGLVSDWRFHTVTLTGGLPDSFPQTLEASRSINPILPVILRHLDEPVDLERVVPDADLFNSAFYRSTFAPHGITRVLATAHLDVRSGLYSLITLYRRDLEQRWSAQDIAHHRRLPYHLVNAASHLFFLHLNRTHERMPAGAAAVVDEQGRFHESQPKFLDLLDQHFPARREPNSLPFARPPQGKATVVADALCARSTRLGDLWLIHLWPAGPLDRLTAREREIVLAVSQGLSFKQAARKIGVAPSTVANHLYRIYRKLGVYSRSELAELVYPAPEGQASGAIGPPPNPSLNDAF